MTDTAVVILNFNGRKYLEKFLPSVIKFSKGASIYVVDNASTDDSLDFLHSSYSNTDITVIALEVNKGYTGGYNESLKLINAEIFVLLNTDAVVTEGWLHPIIQLMDENREIAACQPKILSYNEKHRFDYAGAAGGFIDYLGFPFCRGRIFRSIEEDTGQFDDTCQIFWASGACLFIRKDPFVKLGGFDEDYFAHMEEIDLCWRLQNAGYKIFYVGSSTIFHVGGGTLSRTNPTKTYLNFRNGLSMFLKNEKPGRLWWKFPARAILDFVAALKFSFFDSWRDGASVIKAHFHFWANIGINIKKRKEAKSKWLENKPELQIYRGFIVLDHFLKGKERFEQIKFKPKLK